MSTSITLEVHSDEPRFVELLESYKKMGLKEQYEIQVAIHQFEAARLSRAIGRMEEFDSRYPRGGGKNRKAKTDA